MAIDYLLQLCLFLRGLIYLRLKLSKFDFECLIWFTRIYAHFSRLFHVSFLFLECGWEFDVLVTFWNQFLVENFQLLFHLLALSLVFCIILTQFVHFLLKIFQRHLILIINLLKLSYSAFFIIIFSHIFLNMPIQCLIRLF